MTSLEIDGVTFGYGGSPVLDGVTLTFDSPGLICILGPNGVGKTTLAKCIVRLIRPDSGRISLDGADISSMGSIELARRMAFVPNSESSAFSMTVAEAVLMGRQPHSGWSVSRRDLEVTDAVLRRMDLLDLSSCSIGQLSAGQRQRAMIARGLAQEPEIMVLDEPTSNLDVRYQMEVMGFLRRYARDKGITAIMVCHDLNLTSAYADRIVLMSEGRVHSDGTASEVMTEEAIREVYGVESRIIDMDGIPHVALIPRRDERWTGELSSA